MLVRNPKFYRSVFAIATPIVMQLMITVGVNIMDTVMLAKLGEAQISGSSLANQYISIFQICCMGLGMGASVLTARYWGAEQIRPLKNVLTIMLWLTVGFALLFTLPAAVAPEAVMKVYTDDPSIRLQGARYFRWSIPSFLLGGLSMTTSQALRSIGKVRVPLIGAVIAFVVNVFCNYVFIFGKLGAPRMEIAGAALGTVIARGGGMPVHTRLSVS